MFSNILITDTNITPAAVAMLFMLTKLSSKKPQNCVPGYVLFVIQPAEAQWPDWSGLH